MDTLNKHQTRSKASTKAMLDVATDLLLEGGFSALTFVQIGKRCGFSRGLVTARFGSKAGLLEALIDHIVVAWQDRTLKPMLARGTGLEGALVLLEGISRQIDRDDRQLRALYVIYFDSISGEPVLTSRMIDFHETLRADIAGSLNRGVEDGSVRPDADVELEAGLLVAALRGIGFQWMLDPERFDPVPSLNHVCVTTAERLGTNTIQAPPLTA